MLPYLHVMSISSTGRSGTPADPSKQHSIALLCFLLLLLLLEMITKLSTTTIQKIASGQLILDIPSIVKELIENSLDANATKIILTLEDEALTSLSVTPLPSLTSIPFQLSPALSSILHQLVSWIVFMPVS
jgi:hypothetical protein